MQIKKIIGKIHLILGLGSGLVIFCLGVTGCLLAFELEITKLFEPYQFTKKEARPLLPPSRLKSIAESHFLSKQAVAIEYPGENKSAIAYYFGEKNYEKIFLNPYTGAVLKQKDMSKDFFRFILEGHNHLWLPHNIGQPVTASATLIFLVMMITGLVLWWPKNKSDAKERFTVKWSASWRRKNYDLHNVFGFYMTWVGIFLAVTGLVMGFQWFSKSIYWLASGGQSTVAYTDPVSDTTLSQPAFQMADHLWAKHKRQAKATEIVGVYFPSSARAPIEIAVNHRPGTYYNMDFYHYDQYSGAFLPATGRYAAKFKEAKIADKILRMNYDLHVGGVLGFTGKLLMFFASLVAASLPVTGFMIWWGRRA